MPWPSHGAASRARSPSGIRHGICPVGLVQIEVVLKEIQQGPPQHLDDADAGRHRDGPGLPHSVLAQQAHHVGWQSRGDGHRQHHENADQQEWRAEQQRAHRRAGGREQPSGSVAGAWRMSQQHDMDRRAHQKLQSRQAPQGVAPSDGADEPHRQRYENRADQAIQKGKGDDGAPEVVRKTPRHDGELRRIEGCRHAHAEQSPHCVEAGQACNQTMQHQARSHQNRATRHDQSLMAAVDPASHRISAQTFGQQGQAERQRRLDAAQAQFLFDSAHQERKGVEDAAPGSDSRRTRRRSCCGWRIIGELSQWRNATFQACESGIYRPNMHT